MKSIAFAITLTGLSLLAGSASAQMRYASRMPYDTGAVKPVAYYNPIEDGGCCGGPGCGGGLCGGCGPCCQRCCLLPCVLRSIGRAIDCLLPCGRCCGGCGGCGSCGSSCNPCRGAFGCRVGCLRCPYYGCGGCNAVPYAHARPPVWGSPSGGCASCGGGAMDDGYSAPYAPPMKANPFQDDMDGTPTPAPQPAPTRSTRTNGSSRMVRPARTAAAERPQMELDEEPVRSVKPVAAKKQIIGTGVAKVLHEEPVTVRKPVTSLKKLPKDDAPAPPDLFDDLEETSRSSLPKNPLRR